MPRDVQGAADPEVPGWEDRVMDAVKRSRKRNNRWTDRRNGTLVTYDDPFRELLHLAAERRNISMNGYCRRAIAAFIAKDLGLTWLEVVGYAAKPEGYKTSQGPKQGPTQDDGEGHGPWIIVGKLVDRSVD